MRRPNTQHTHGDKAPQYLIKFVASVTHWAKTSCSFWTPCCKYQCRASRTPGDSPSCARRGPPRWIVSSSPAVRCARPIRRSVWSPACRPGPAQNFALSRRLTSYCNRAFYYLKYCKTTLLRYLHFIIDSS